MKKYLCLQLHTNCAESLLKTVLVSAAAQHLYRQPVEEVLVSVATHQLYRQPGEEVLVSAATHQLYKQSVEENTCVRTATTFHPLVLNHDKSLLEQKNYGQNLC